MGVLELVSNNEQPQEEIDHFAIFWTLYPRKIAKKAAMKAWSRIHPRFYPEIVTALVAWNRVWKDKDPDFICHASTWLHGERWTDELPRDVKATAAAHIPFSAGNPEKFEKQELPTHVREAIRKALNK